MGTKKLLAGSVWLFGMIAGHAALAADLPAKPAYKAPPPVATTDIWNGFYVGINGGGSVSRNRTTDTTVLPGQAFPVFDTASFAHAPAGGVFGAQAGWNWHAGPSWVLGVEADWQWSGQKEMICTYGCFPPNGNGALIGVTDEQSLKWFGTARARIGWLTPGGSLWYATGGAAWGRVDQTLNLIGTPGFFPVGTTSGASFSHDKIGWTIGAGIETPLPNNKWSLKAEYLYVDLGRVTDTFSSPVDPGQGPGPQTTTSSSSIRDHIVRLGLNYHFDAPSGTYAMATAPPRTAAYGWSGFYAGLNGGAAITRNPTTDTTVVPSIATIIGAESFSHAAESGVFGAQIGVNWRAAPSWVLGAEADWQWSLQKDSVCISECLPAAVAGTLVALTDEQTLKWFGTARARFGWVAPSGALWYATGGAAWARIDQTLSLIAVPGVPFFAVGSTNAASFSHNKAGWTVGGGVEIPLWNRFTAKAEYLYVDLGSVTNSFTTALDPNIALGPQTTTSSSAIRDHIVRFGLNYHFN